ncbi:hypothetical protein [Amphiplicatus metriothermophilus]|uniref:Lipoprotein n=1 Tax=Amphiplicatus metriothermophilus TaxID=1519374 RepID=A0A239PPA2_9PROT|nr:hypothetical protein [Amphiplicatus metriothermophilus]MBB5518750.1 hypothetical protein [Amphiplicatus metriothermophilus]SNT72095.1 hypothetical protein SAMN06297382_1126 [Amphiplicatus metriothermophilus]
MLRRYMIAAMLLASGCASAPPSGPVSTAAPSAGGEGIALGALANAGLNPGECGMILWTLDENRPAPIFRYVVGKAAEISANGALIRLAPVGAEGAAAFGVHESQTFEAPDGTTAHVEARFGLGFDRGVYLERGLVRVDAPDGWRAVAPAAGIAGCRAK